MNRILKRPMFRIGGSAGTGITSGLDKPRKQYSTGTPNPYNMGAFAPGSTAGLLTGIGLDLLSRPPGGNIFQTVASAAKGPLQSFQANQAAQMKTASDRKFARELSEEEREFEASQLEKKLATQERIAGMDKTNIQDIANEEYGGDTIKAQRRVDFPTKVYPGLIDQYGKKQVSTTTIDSSTLQKPRDVDKFVDANPFLASKFVYDVATDKTVIFVKDRLTGKYKIIPADSSDIDTTGEDMPDPNRTPGLFGQKTKPGKELKEILPDFTDPGFDEEFYQ